MTCLNVRLLSNRPHHGRVFYGTFFAFAFVLPMTLICVLYARMIVRLLCGRHGGVTGSHRTAGTSDSARVRRRATRLVVVVVAAFGACWLPIHVVFMVQYFDAEVKDESKITHAFVAVRLAANCLAYANSCLNPILYAFLSENFRSGLGRLCCCRDDARRRSVVEEARRQRAGGRGSGDGAVMSPLMVIVEERNHPAKQVARLDADITTALQTPLCNVTRLTETSAVVETAL